MFFQYYSTLFPRIWGSKLHFFRIFSSIKLHFFQEQERYQDMPVNNAHKKEPPLPTTLNNLNKQKAVR